MKKKITVAGILFFIMALIVLYVHQVDNTITEDDRVFIQKFLDDAGVKNSGTPATRQFREYRFDTYQQELEFIIDVQSSVFKRAPTQDGIPYFSPREPKDLYKARKGLCYDRSRVIEKILRWNGFSTRHIAMYSHDPDEYPLLTLSKPGVPSHAVSEVRTQKGWLVVDSYDPWISITSTRHPVSIEEIQTDVVQKKIKWHPLYEKQMNAMYKKPFIFLYGLYSRHGKLYPPYNFIPDVNYKELLYNFVD